MTIHLCSHDRLMHDSWGCKQCDCKVSIIYLTLQRTTPEQDQATLDQSKAFDVKEDRLQEFKIRMMVKRAAVERES